MTREMLVLPALKTLPDKYYENIGRVMTKWGFLEWKLRETLYTLLRINPKQGRLTIGNPRASDILNRITDLASLEGLSINVVDVAKLGNLIREGAEVRNDLAHGVWAQHPDIDAPVLQKITGSYSLQEGSKKRMSARINPQAMHLSIEEMEKLAANIDHMIDAVVAVKQELESKLQEKP